MKNYSIFRHGLKLYGYFETADLEKTIAHLNQGEVNKKWGEFMTPIMKIEVDTQTNFPFLLPLQWHMD
jgi:L-rhamnose mutarotase